MPKFQKYIIANWKMNMSLEQVESWLHNFDKFSKNLTPKVKVILAPSFPYLLHVRAATMEKAQLAVAAQTVSVFNGGSYTGQIGSFQLKDFCQFCILGHSETKDTIEEVIKKRDTCLQSHITPIICFTKLKDGVALYKDGVILAWEDPNTISVQGEYHAQDPKEVEQNIVAIKKLLPVEAKVLYGGSVNRPNALKLANIIQLDGVLVGNASLDPHHLYEIAQAFEL